MKTCILSYSLSGNNRKLAQRISEKLELEHFRIETKSKINMFTIYLYILFNKTPDVTKRSSEFSNYDFLIIIGPVWMEKLAAPLRGFLNFVKNNKKQYAIISLGGGDINSKSGIYSESYRNKRLYNNVIKTVKKEPKLFIDYYISDLVDRSTTTKELMKYKPTDKDIDKMAIHTVNIFRQTKG